MKLKQNLSQQGFDMGKSNIIQSFFKGLIQENKLSLKQEKNVKAIEIDDEMKLFRN